MNYQPGFVPSNFDPDDPMAQQNAYAQALAGQQQQPQGQDQTQNLLAQLLGVDPAKDPIGALQSAGILGQLPDSVSGILKSGPTGMLLRGLANPGALGGLFGGG